MLQTNDPSHDPARRLESWKEIAVFLGVSVRTAQSWEKERGLPVRRLGGNRRSRVHAYAGELEDWLRASKIRQHPAEDANDAGPGWWRLALASALVLLFLAAWALVAKDPLPGPARLTVHGELLQAFDAQGNLLWNRRFPGIDPTRYEKGVMESQRALVHDIDGDRAPEVLFEALPRNSMAEPSTLYCLDADGEIRWQRHSAERFDGARFDLDGSFSLRGWELVHEDEGLSLLTLAAHTPRFPMEVALLDPATGEPVGAPYYHPGHFYRWLWQDLDGDGDTELILGGINNPGPGIGHAVVVILDVPFEAGGSAPSDFFGEPGPLPLAYVLLPRMDVNETLRLGSRVQTLSAVAGGEPGEFRATVTVGGETFLYYDLVYRGPGDVAVNNLFPADSLYPMRKRLVVAGELEDTDTDAELETMRQITVSRLTPDGNPP